MANASPRRGDLRERTAYSRSVYVDGNTARHLQALPQEQEYASKKVSRETRRNRERVLNMSAGFVLFLAVMCVAALFSCINFLRMKAQLTEKESLLAGLESEYSQLKADNDAYYSQVSTSLDIDHIKDVAINRLGMKYATDDQIVTYETERSSYVRQYQDVPDADR